MRKLTVIRNKSNTARFSSMRVFAEDEENGNINLYGVKCRLLGTLKNGASATYEISEKSAEILFVGSSFSWKHDLPEGEEDVVLEGEVVSISGVGRAFAVKGDESQIEEVSQRIRSKNTKRSTLIRVLAILLVCAAPTNAILSFLKTVGLLLLLNGAFATNMRILPDYIPKNDLPESPVRLSGIIV